MEEHTSQKNWFSRNWPWVVPVGGCLTLITILLFVAGAAIFSVSKVFTGSEPYTIGLEKAQQDEYLQEELGIPIESNGIMQGSISTINDTGEVNITIPIKGPNGEAIIYVKGAKENDTWTYSEIYVIIDKTNESLDLLWGGGTQQPE